MSRRIALTQDGGAKRTLSAGGRHNEIRGELWYSPSLQGQRRNLTVTINTTLGKITVADMSAAAKSRNVVYESKFIALTATSWFTHEGGHGRGSYGTGVGGKWFYFTVAVQKPDGSETTSHHPPEKKNTPRQASVANKPRAHTPLGRSALLRHPNTLPSTVVTTPRGCETLVFSTNKQVEKKKWEHFFRNPIKSTAHVATSPAHNISVTSAKVAHALHSEVRTAGASPSSSSHHGDSPGHSSPRTTSVSAGSSSYVSAPVFVKQHSGHSAMSGTHPKTVSRFDVSDDEMSLLIDVVDAPAKVPTHVPTSVATPASRARSAERDDIDVKALQQLRDENGELRTLLSLRSDALQSTEMERHREASQYKGEIDALRAQLGNSAPAHLDCHRCTEDKNKRREEVESLRKAEHAREKTLRRRLDTLANEILSLQAHQRSKPSSAASIAQLLDIEGSTRQAIEELYGKLSTEAFSMMDSVWRMLMESSTLDRTTTTRQSSLPTMFGSPQTPGSCSRIMEDVLERDILLEAAEQRLLLSLESASLSPSMNESCHTPPRVAHSPERVWRSPSQEDTSEEWTVTSTYLDVHVAFNGAEGVVCSLGRGEVFRVHDAGDDVANVSCTLRGTIDAGDLGMLQDFARLDSQVESARVRAGERLQVTVGPKKYSVPEATQLFVVRDEVHDKDKAAVKVTLTVCGEVRVPVADVARRTFHDGWVVIGSEGATVRAEEELASRIVGEPLCYGTAVSVSRVSGNRAYITAPVCGWVSLYARSTIPPNNSHQILERCSAHRQAHLETAQHAHTEQLRTVEADLAATRQQVSLLTSHLEEQSAVALTRDAEGETLRAAAADHADALEEVRAELDDKAAVADFYLEKVCQLEHVVMTLSGENATQSEVHRALTSELALHKSHLTDASLVSDSAASTADSEDTGRSRRSTMCLKSLMEVQKEELRIKATALERLNATHEATLQQLHNEERRSAELAQQIEEVEATRADSLKALVGDMAEKAAAQQSQINEAEEAVARLQVAKSDMAVSHAHALAASLEAAEGERAELIRSNAECLRGLQEEAAVQHAAHCRELADFKAACEEQVASLHSSVEDEQASALTLLQQRDDAVRQVQVLTRSIEAYRVECEALLQKTPTEAARGVLMCEAEERAILQLAEAEARHETTHRCAAFATSQLEAACEASDVVVQRLTKELAAHASSDKATQAAQLAEKEALRSAAVLQATVEQLRQDLGALREKHAKLTDELDTSHQEQDNQYQSLLDKEDLLLQRDSDAEQVRSDLRNTLNSLQQAQDHARDSDAKLAQYTKDAQHAVHGLQQTVLNLQRDAAATEDKYTRHVKESKRAVENLQETLCDAEREAAAAKHLATTTADELATVQEHNTRLAQQAKEALREVHELQQNVLGVERDAATVEADLTAAQEHCAASDAKYTQHVKESKRAVENLQETLCDTEREAAAAKHLATTTADELATVQEHNTRLAQQAKEAQREVHELQQSVLGVERDAAATTLLAATTGDELSATQRTLEQMERKLEAKVSRISDMQEEHQAAAAQHSAAVYKLQIETGQVQAELAASERSLSKASTALETAKREGERLQDELRSAARSSMKEKRLADETKLALEEEAMSLRNAVRCMENDAETRRDDSAALRDALSQAQRAASEAREDVFRLEKEAADVRSTSTADRTLLTSLRKAEAQREADTMSMQYRVSALQTELDRRDEAEKALHQKLARLEVEAAVAAALKEQVVSLEVDKSRAAQKASESVHELEEACRAKDNEIMRLEEWAAQQACKQAEDQARLWKEDTRATQMQAEAEEKERARAKQALVKTVKRVAAAEAGKARTAERVARECERRASIAEESEWQVRKEKALLEDELTKERSRSAGSDAAAVVAARRQARTAPSAPSKNESPVSAGKMRNRAAELEDRWGPAGKGVERSKLKVALDKAQGAGKTAQPVGALGLSRVHEDSAVDIAKLPKSTPSTPRALSEISMSATNSKAFTEPRKLTQYNTRVSGFVYVTISPPNVFVHYLLNLNTQETAENTW